MKNDILKTLADKSVSELNTELESKKKELFNLRFQVTVGQLQNTAAIKTCKKDIARVKTLIRQRELAGK